jgi:hypothetical protein
MRRRISGPQIQSVQAHEARLAAAIRVHGVKRILTFNDRDFARYSDVEAVHPLAVPTELDKDLGFLIWFSQSNGCTLTTQRFSLDNPENASFAAGVRRAG